MTQILAYLIVKLSVTIPSNGNNIAIQSLLFKVDIKCSQMLLVSVISTGIRSEDKIY